VRSVFATGCWRATILTALRGTRAVKRAGEVDDTPANLPQPLVDLLSDPLNLGITKTRLRSYLQKQGIPESTVGGSVTDRICHADDDNPSAPLARYFVIHDTSFKLATGRPSTPRSSTVPTGHSTNCPLFREAEPTSTSLGWGKP
jgi:hypothetical protein